GAELDHLRPLPERLPRQSALEPDHVGESVAVVARLVDLHLGRAVAQRDRGDLGQRGGHSVLTEERRVPGDVNDTGHWNLLVGYAPTSARIAPGPSAVLP